MEHDTSYTPSRPLQQSESAPPARLLISVEIVDQIVAHLRKALPEEGCGLLATNLQHDGHVTRFFPGTNVDSSSVRFTMDPTEVVQAFREMRQNDWRLGAIVHSHPRTQPTPSLTDLDEAYYPEALMLIVSFQSDAAEMRAWQVSTSESGEVGIEERPIIVQ